MPQLFLWNPASSNCVARSEQTPTTIEVHLVSRLLCNYSYGILSLNRFISFPAQLMITFTVVSFSISYLCNDEGSVEVTATDQTNTPRRMLTITLQCDGYLTYFMHLALGFTLDRRCTQRIAVIGIDNIL